MNEYLNAYISKKISEEKQERNKLLINQGLYIKNYIDSSKYTETELSNFQSEWDGSETKYFSIIPIELSEEEYKEFLKYSPVKEVKESKNNVIASILQIIAWVTFICGFISGIAFRGDYDFSFTAIIWAVSLIEGSFTLGFAEIIKLLEEIKNK